MAYTGIDSYAKPHGSGKSNGGTRIQVINKGGANTFDPNYVNINTLEAHNANIDNLRVTSATIDNAQFKYIMSPNGVINKIQGDELNYALGRIDDLNSSNIGTTKLTVHDEANIKNLINEYLKTHEINTDYLTVNRSAHFFELIVDKIRSVQGTQMNTAANCVIDYVEAYDYDDQLMDMNDPDFYEDDVKFYRIYWKNTDDDGRSINNEWLEHDQAICWTFNVKEGQTQNVSNKYYWRLVDATDNGSVKYINFKTNEVKDTQPATFEILFANGFQYGDTVDPSDNYNNFTVTSQIIGEYDASTLIWTPSSTLYGIQIVANPADNRILAGGGLIFETDIPTKLNIGVYYDDGTFDYFQGQEYTYSYNIITAENKNAEAFILCTAELDKWESCNWIDLSNMYADIGRIGTKSIPEAGDNICQLGYRYTMLPGYENTDAWRNLHKKDVARASAIIIAAYDTPDGNVFPPSYAQYQNIIDFILGDWSYQGVDYTNRGTYFDATGAYIKGTLVAGTTVESGVSLPISVDDWRLKADTSVITKDTNNTIQPPYITLSLLYNNGTTSEEIHTLPNNKRVYVNGVDSYSYAPSNPLVIDTSYYGFNKYNIELKSYGGSPQTFDKLIIDKFDINATNGQNGSYIQFIYCNWYPVEEQTVPDTPTQDAFPPSGWYTSAPALLDGEFTFMSQRTISFTSANVEQHGSWTNPVRISGENGINGADGDGVEFIYCRTTDDTPPSLFNSYVDIPSPSLLDSYTIEYLIMPGQSGYDTDANLVRIWREGLTTHNMNDLDYLPPSIQSSSSLSTSWTDEPQGVNETYLYEWVAVRTYDGTGQDVHGNIGCWGPFSDPVIWAKYGENGINGVDGVNGIDGKDGEGWFLVPIVHDFSVKIKAASNYDNIVGVVSTNLKFGIEHIDGDTTEWVSAADLADYSLNLITNNTYGRNICRSTDTQQASQVNFEITSVTVDGTSIPVISVTSPNYLRYTSNVQTDESAYGNYYNLHKHIGDSDPSYRNAMFTQMTIQLVRTGIAIMDTYTQDLIFDANHILTASDNALNSVYQGLSGDVNPITGTYATGFSQIRQAWDNINLNVNNLTTFSHLPQSNNLTQYAWYRKGSVEAPAKPVGTVQVNSDVTGQWTTYEYPYPSYTYQYMYSSQRTRIQNAYSYYGAWGAWSEPVVIYTYNGGLATNANSATLDIKADQIQSTVSQTYLTKSDAEQTYTTMSQVTQTATSISAQVKTDIEGDLQETGIDIQQGRITLNADTTTIAGNNLVLNQDQGILIKDSDDYNNIYITSKDIDDFNTTETTETIRRTFKSNVVTFEGNNTEQEFTFDTTDLEVFDFGRLGEGSNIKISSGSINLPFFQFKDVNNRGYMYDGCNYIAIYDWTNKSLIISLRRDGTVIASCARQGIIKSGTVSPFNQTNKVQLDGDINYTVPQGDSGHTYDVVISVSNVRPDDTSWIGNLWCEATVEFKVTSAKTNNITIGTNGMNVIANPMHGYINNTTFLVEDTTKTANTNRTGIKINTGYSVPLQKGRYVFNGLTYDAWCTTGTIMRIKSENSSSNNLNHAYDYYLFWGDMHAYDRDLGNYKIFYMTPNVPQAAGNNSCIPIGKIIYLKNTSPYKVICEAYFQTPSSDIPLLVDLNSNTRVNTITIQSCGQASFIWVGEYFIRIS